MLSIFSYNNFMKNLKDPKYLFQSQKIIKAKEKKTQKEHIRSLREIQKELKILLLNTN